MPTTDHAGELGWFSAIVKVLQQAGGAMHYIDIADAIVSGGLKSTLGATPAATVNSVISVDIAQKGAGSQFIRIGRGQYVLRSVQAAGSQAPTTPAAAPSLLAAPNAAATAAAAILGDDEVEETSAIQALGMFWRRDLVVWTTTPPLLGRQQKNAALVDFSGQRGIYLLHDGRETVYAGRITDQPLGKRLAQHTTDRLNGRWDRFSWFGVHRVTDPGKLVPQTGLQLAPGQVIVELEAVLIEALEPPLNRRRGDGLRAVEYIQVEAPAPRQQQLPGVVQQLRAKLLGGG